MTEVLFIGTYPGLTREMLDYVIDTVQAILPQQNLIMSSNP